MQWMCLGSQRLLFFLCDECITNAEDGHHATINFSIEIEAEKLINDACTH